MDPIIEEHQDFLIEAAASYVPERMMWRPAIRILPKGPRDAQPVVDDAELFFSTEAEAQDFALQRGRMTLGRRSIWC
jgi:hypothetical protein